MERNLDPQVLDAKLDIKLTSQLDPQSVLTIDSESGIERGSTLEPKSVMPVDSKLDPEIDSELDSKMRDEPVDEHEIYNATIDELTLKDIEPQAEQNIQGATGMNINSGRGVELSIPNILSCIDRITHSPIAPINNLEIEPATSAWVEHKDGWRNFGKKSFLGSDGNTHRLQMFGIERPGTVVGNSVNHKLDNRAVLSTMNTDRDIVLIVDKLDTVNLLDPKSTVQIQPTAIQDCGSTASRIYILSANKYLSEQLTDQLLRFVRDRYQSTENCTLTFLTELVNAGKVNETNMNTKLLEEITFPVVLPNYYQLDGEMVKQLFTAMRSVIKEELLITRVKDKQDKIKTYQQLLKHAHNKNTCELMSLMAQLTEFTPKKGAPKIKYNVDGIQDIICKQLNISKQECNELSSNNRLQNRRAVDAIILRDLGVSLKTLSKKPAYKAVEKLLYSDSAILLKRTKTDYERNLSTVNPPVAASGVIPTATDAPARPPVTKKSTTNLHKSDLLDRPSTKQPTVIEPASSRTSESPMVRNLQLTAEILQSPIREVENPILNPAVLQQNGVQDVPVTTNVPVLSRLEQDVIKPKDTLKVVGELKLAEHSLMG